MKATAHDYYGVLGVAPDATDEEIRKAFHERVRACHPDRVATLDEELRLLAEHKMVALNEAYAVLCDPPRRTAYDEQLRSSAGAPTAASNDTVEIGSNAATPFVAPRSDDAQEATTEASGRIGEQRFVTTAACEEFEHTVRRCIGGRVSWTPVAFDGATLALHGRRGRANLYFALRAEAHLEPRRTRRFFRALRSFGDKLGSGLLARNRLFGFAAAVTFEGPERQQRALQRFNRALAGNRVVQPASFIELQDWHVIPGEASLQARLEELIRGA